MTNLTNAKVIWCKGILFVCLGLLASGLLIARTPELTKVLLLGITVWAFYRAYYFAFYVIQRYVDPSYRFGGLGDFMRYALTGKHADYQNRGEQIKY